MYLFVAVKHDSHQELDGWARRQGTPEANPQPGETDCSGKSVFPSVVLSPLGMYEKRVNQLC